MKKSVAVLTVLCGGLLVINPVVNIFAQSTNNKIIQEVQNIENNNDIEIVKDEIIENQIEQEDVKVNNIEKEETKFENDELIIEENTKEEVKEENVVEVIDVLNEEEAKELLKMYKKDVEFEYQGNENDFKILSQKGLSGYVFLPDYYTDLGFFVDKNTSSIYYFHPSGYLELAL